MLWKRRPSGPLAAPLAPPGSGSGQAGGAVSGPPAARPSARAGAPSGTPGARSGPPGAVAVAPGGTVSGWPLVADADQALDTVAALVRSFGAHAFDTGSRDAEDLRASAESWAGRILLGRDAEGGGAAPRRDFGGLRRFFDEARRDEAEYVRATQSNLRGAIQVFARCMRSALLEDRDRDVGVASRIDALHVALGTNDPARIREHSVALAASVQEAISARRAREAQQIAALGEQLHLLRGELARARERASLDGLTRLFNRAAFDEHVARISDLGLLLGAPPTLLLLDVDHFKAINDRHGHPAGDEVLRRVAECLVRTFLRKEDFVARYGGEEFAVVLLDASAADARALAERLLRALRTLEISHGGVTISVTASVGLASLVGGEGAASWIERADTALYAAKHGGRDRAAVAALPAAFA